MLKIKKKTVYILIGLPGIGKSAWVRKQLDDDKKLTCVSKDSLRSMMWSGDYKYITEHEPLIKVQNFSCVLKALCCGYDIIVDGCHTTKKQRCAVAENIYAQFPPEEIDIIYVQFIMDLAVDVPTCLARRCEDPKGLPVEAWPPIINGLAKGYEPPKPDEISQVKGVLFSWNSEFLT